MGIAPVEQFQNERWVVDTSPKRTDIESRTFSGNALGLFNRTDRKVFKQVGETFISTFDSLPIHSQHIAEAEPLRIIRHSDDAEFRFELDALSGSNPLTVALDCDSGWHDLCVITQILMQPVEDHRNWHVLRKQGSRR